MKTDRSMAATSLFAVDPSVVVSCRHTNNYCDVILTYYPHIILIGSGARPTKHISIEFEIRWKFKTL